MGNSHLWFTKKKTISTNSLFDNFFFCQFVFVFTDQSYGKQIQKEINFVLPDSAVETAFTDPLYSHHNYYVVYTTHSYSEC